MASLRCVIADDEPLALELLESLLRRHGDLEIVAACRDGHEALDAIRKLNPDLAFLDIEMPNLSGFDVIRRLQPETMPAIIFTTAFNQYAIDAFEIHAVDYVLKPLNAERLGMAVDRARLRFAGQQWVQADNKASIMSAIDRLAVGGEAADAMAGLKRAPVSNEPRKLLIRDSRKTHVVEPAGIDWVDAAGDYMCIHVGPETLVARITMKSLEEQLDAQQFVRIHRSTLVNASKVQEIENLGKGDCMVHLDGDVKLRVSRHYRQKLLNLLL